MRVRRGLAISLLQPANEDAALEHFRAMLKLNPNDNQSIRSLFLAGLLRWDDLPEAKALPAAYGDEWSATWLYTRAVVAFREKAEGQAGNPEAAERRPIHERTRARHPRWDGAACNL